MQFHKINKEIVMSTSHELNATAVNETLSAQGPVCNTASYPFTVCIFEQFGRAFISWALAPNYAIGTNDVVQLREGATWVNNWPVTGPNGTVDTGHVWGSGLNASYWSWNFHGVAGWRQLVVTPNTKEG